MASPRWFMSLVLILGLAEAWVGVPSATAQSDASALAFDPAGLTVPQGGTASAKVMVALRVGQAGGTTLKAWDMPAGMTVSFHPSAGNPPFIATMAVTVSTTVKAGPYTVKVQATGANPSNVAAYVVTVDRSGGGY